MRNSTTTVFGLILYLLLGISCACGSEVRVTEKGRYNSAELYRSDPDKPGKQKVDLDRAAANQLARLLPELDTNEEAGNPGFWALGWSVNFIDADGKSKIDND